MKIIRILLALLCANLSYAEVSFPVSLQYLNIKNNETLFKKMNDDFYQYALTKIDHNFDLELYTNWEINYPAAATHRNSDLPPFDVSKRDSWVISALGGYWRDINFGSPMVHLLVLCHELAHHNGGEPYKLDDDGNVRWASMEPQADYFATKECVPDFLSRYPQWIKDKSLHIEFVHPVIESNCQNIYQNNDQYELCMQTSQASLNLAYLHQEYLLPGQVEDPVTPYFEEDKVVSELDRNNYPSSQCRLDTHIRGVLGLERPSCWFPKK